MFIALKDSKIIAISDVEWECRKEAKGLTPAEYWSWLESVTTKDESEIGSFDVYDFSGEDYDIHDIAPEEYDASKEGTFDAETSDSNLGRIKSIIQKIEIYEYLNKKTHKN